MTTPFEKAMKEAVAAKKNSWPRRILFYAHKCFTDMFYALMRMLTQGDFWAATVIVGMLFTLITVLVYAPPGDSNNADHYNTDFRTFCTQLHGKTIIDDRDLCLNSTNKILMQEHDPSEANHYNRDFARYCTNRGGSATVGIAHDICVKGGTLIMREGKYSS